MMTAWKGLWKKEWLMMKDWIYATTVMAVLLVFVISGGFSFLTERKLSMSVMAGMSLMLWTVIAVCVPIALLLNSLWSEWKRPDVWLQSPRSIYQLFGNKTIFAGVIGFIAVLIPAIVFSVYASVFDTLLKESGALDFFLMIYSFTSTLYLGAIGFMLIGLFLAVVYRVIKSHIPRGAIFIWLAVLFISNWLFQLLLESELYRKIAHMGAFTISFEPREYIAGDFYFVQSPGTWYAGQILLVFVFLAFLFFSSAWLFEKKVRL
ncbi:hypothetical protein [Sporosarcina cascadiensis]|uniref:hypothetical protein n=1 Tax=Sporosarcina cascadiensis TaxID=2660747 RepID=UPI00129B4D1B|nr:hypothetical protein [Sporosarcina cascadiensis]